MAGPNVEQAFQVKEDQVEWLKKMAEEYNLPDEHKALRVLIDYAMKHGDLERVFVKIHCLRCNTDVGFRGIGFKQILKHNRT